MLAATRWLSCNEAEARFIAGASSDIAAGLLERHCPKADGVVIRRGAQGCLARLRNGQERAIPGYEVEAVDTNGAGDTHIGAFIAALSRGDNPFAAARYANAAAAIAVTRRGGPTGPTHAEIEEFLAARNARPERRAG